MNVRIGFLVIIGLVTIHEEPLQILEKDYYRKIIFPILLIF